MKSIESIIRAAVSEIEDPHRSTAFFDGLKKMPAGAENGGQLTGAIVELLEIKSASASYISSCEAVTGFIRSNDFVLARNLMAFGLIAAFSFFSLKFCSADNIIFSLYGATAYYILLILLSPLKIKKYKLLKERAVREYREKLILFSCGLIKKYSLDPSIFAINLKGAHMFINLTENKGVYYFKIND
jgi:hypothetical protein